MTTPNQLQSVQIPVTLKISALWTAMLFVFAYVDIFSFFRPDVRASIEAGQIAGFDINQAFLVGTTIYILIPSLMVAGAIFLRPRLNRVLNIVLPVIYGLTIVAGAVGEWGYYILGSAVELILLAGIVYLAWTWPRVETSAATANELLPTQAV